MSLTYSVCVETMSNIKFMEKLDKADKLLLQFPHGVSAKDFAKKFGVHRTQVYEYLNALEVREKAYSEHGLWFPKEKLAEKKPSCFNVFEYLKWERQYEDERLDENIEFLKRRRELRHKEMWDR